MAKAPIDIRSLARSHAVMAIETLAGIARAGTKDSDRAYCAVALLNRGFGLPQGDADSREHINITIRKILEGSVTVVETTTAREPLVIDHDDVRD